MRSYGSNFSDEIGRLIVDVALCHARVATPPASRSNARFVDTGLTPDELYQQCLARLADSSEQDPSVDAWQPLAVWAADTRFQQGMFRFLVKIEEALGHLTVLRDEDGKPRVAVSSDIAPANRTNCPLLTQAGPA